MVIETSLLVNGEQVIAMVDPNESVLKFLRKELGLVGAKNGCAKGHCGTCTVIVNGKAQRSCLLRMGKLYGASIETIEGLSKGGDLHPLQVAFAKAGAVQCGFCTPGMIMCAKALLDKNVNPSELDIKNALKHNICRCTGYKKIIEAVKMAASALRGEINLKVGPDQGWVGESIVRKDAISKVKGIPLYTDDFRLEGTLEGKLLLSSHPHARIISIDIRDAEKAPGVVAVLTAKDIPGRKTMGLIIPHQPVLADHIVRFVGDPVALVLAETEEQAEAARDLIRVDYQPFEIVDSPLRALEEDAPQLHEEGNVLAHIKVRKGDVETGFANADVVLEDDFYVPSIEHAYMEPDACLAKPEDDGTITVWTASQSSFSFQDDISQSLGLPKEKIRVINRTTGGAFGGREEPTVQIHAALGVLKTGRPVRMVLSREELIKMSTKRHAEYMRYKIGATKDGLITSLEVKIIGDTGAYASAGEPVLFRSAVFCSGPYEVPNAKVDALAVYTNNPPGGAMRGFGSTQPTFASELMIDKLAVELKMSPFQIREINGLEIGKQTLGGQVLDQSVGYKQTLKAVKDALSKENLPQSKPGKRIGIGIASAMKNVGLGSGMVDGAGATLELLHDGIIELGIGSVDSGQGADTIMAQIAAQSVGVPVSSIQIVASDTSRTLDGGVTTASRQTFVTGNAVRIAGIKFRRALGKFAAEVTGIPYKLLDIKDDYVYDIQDSGHKISLKELAKLAASKKCTLKEQHFYVAPNTKVLKDCSDNPEYDPEEFRLHFAYCYGTQAAIVEVDENTGQVEVLKVIAAHDVGKAINPNAVEGQIEGGIIMGLGYALTEEFKMENGKVVTDNMRKLGLPGISRTPQMESILVEDYHPYGPFGAKGMGELPMNPTAPAIVNAIYDAVGIRFTSLPVRPEMIKEMMSKLHSN